MACGTVVEQFARQAAERPDATALIADGEQLSYATLQGAVRRAAAQLAAAGVQKGDRVVFDVSSPAIAPVVYLGILWLGAVAVPIETAASPDAVGTVAARVEPKLVLGKSEMTGLRELLHGGQAATGTEPVAMPEDLCEIVFSSGTTGSAKGVMLTHANVAAAAAMINGVVGNGPEDREVVTVPISHSFGLGRLRCILNAGGTVIFVPGLRFPAVALRALDEHQATGLSCVPAGIALLQAAARGTFGELARSLRYMELGSAPMSAEAKRSLRDSLPAVRIVMHYGLTEASRSTFLDFTRDDAHLASVGRPNPLVTITIRNEDGAVVPAGTVGTIFVRGRTTTPGYWRDDALTRDRIKADGWLDTRDIGWLDEAGFLHLAGRADDQINVAGQKFMPEIVERVAEAHPLVCEAACVGVPDDLLGQVPSLFVVLKCDAIPDDLMATIARQVPTHAVPRRIERIETLPRTVSGKLQRAILRQQWVR